MDRRRFVQFGFGVAATLTVARAHASAIPLDALHPDRIVFFDAGVPHAAGIAEGLLDRGAAIAVGGDPMHLIGHVERLREAGMLPAQLVGVTREAAPFCLQAWLPAGRGSARLRRLDQDLFFWTLDTARAS